jgi:hypothetical protein
VDITQVTALLLALAAVIGAFTGLFVALAKISDRLDGRLTELLELTRASSHAAGVLEEKLSAAAAPPPPPAIGSSIHGDVGNSPTRVDG